MMYKIWYTEYGGLEIPDFLCIALSFSWQIANVNAGPTSALESMGAKRPFRSHSLNIAVINLQTASDKKFGLGLKNTGKIIICCHEVPFEQEGRQTAFLQ